jgi:hypothetical protein
MSIRHYISLVEAQHQIGSQEFKSWFGGSKVVDAQGNPLRVYHGAMRVDRIAKDNAFHAHKATSGPMSFFTDTPEVASGYASGKPDTSHDDDADWHGLWEINGTKGLYSAWRNLPQARREWITTNGWMVHETDAGFSAQINDEDEDELFISDSQWHEFLRRSRGNGLLALWDVWYQSGKLVQREHDFAKVLQAAGVRGSIAFDHPYEPKAGLVPVYLSIQNPLDTADIPRRVITALTTTSKRKYAQPSQTYGADMWAKHTQDPQEWITRLKDAKEERWVWTSIPDWVTESLKKLGYDGIKDRGGKAGGETHTVWIPFSAGQVKSAVGNAGTYNPNDHRLTS